MAIEIAVAKLQAVVLRVVLVDQGNSFAVIAVAKVALRNSQVAGKERRMFALGLMLPPP